MATTNSIDVSKYVDFSYTGFQSSASLAQQYPFLLKGTEAVKNVIKIYLMSNRGDYGRNLTKGGPLVSALGKKINSATQGEISEMITKALSIFSNIVINSVLVTMDIPDKKWIISISFSDTFNKFVDNINLSITQAQG